MAGVVESPFNELEGIEGNSSVPISIQGRVGRSESKGPFRQHDGYSVPKETRLLVLPSLTGSDSGYLCSSGGSEHLDPPDTLEGKSQCPGRSRVQEGSYRDRVDPGRQVVPMVLRPSGDSSGGFICNQIQSEASEVRVPVPGSGGGGLGRPRENNRLEPVEIFIPLSSICNPGQDGWLAKILQRGRIFDCPFLANSELVPSFEREMSKKDPITKKRVFVPEVFKQGILPQGQFSFKSSRLEVIKEAVMAEGLTEYSAKVLGRCHRLSTIRQYQSVWLKFLKFLEKEKIEHRKVSDRYSNLVITLC